MKYKFKKNQLFRKKLDMPEGIVNKVYNCKLTFQEYIEYNLEDKVPISCLNEIHRMVVEKVGVEKSKNLDWELINLKGFELTGTIKDLDVNCEDINNELYKFVRTDMRPKDYTKMMREKFSTFVLDSDEVDNTLKSEFNSGYLKINDMVSIWEYVKDKNLTLNLKNDYYNKDNVTEEELKRFMKEYSGLLTLIDEPSEIYSLIVNAYRSEKPIDERNSYIKRIVDKILDKTISTDVKLTAEQYKVIFEYTSIKEYLYKKLGEKNADFIMNELDGKDPSYLLEIDIPFDVLIEENVLLFMEEYGLDNIINFDEDCGHFFTNNNCELLKEAYEMYLKYADNEKDESKSVITKKPYGITGTYIERGYTKDEFYEAVRRMIVYGPTNKEYFNKLVDYSIITGEFRELNPELFVDKNAPEDFQESFYTKSLNPIFVRNHYNCISYLIGKKLSTIFSPLYVRISTSDDGYYYNKENVYKFLEEKLGFEETIKIITDYADVFEIIFSSYEKLSQKAYIPPIQFSCNDTIQDIITKINDKLYELIIKANIKYSSNLSKSMKEKYPNVFISYKAPKELHDMFYNRQINAKYIIENKDEKKYFEGLDIELFFDYMPIVFTDNSNPDNPKRKIENLVTFVKYLFENEEGLEILLSYHTYLDKVNEKMGFSKIEFDEQINNEEFLEQIDSLIYLNIIRGDILYDENMPTHFKAAYPSLFLTDNTPEDIKHKFYNRLFTLDDFNENPVLLKYFANTDIACCLDTTFSYMIGLFDSTDFLDIIKICGENIKSDINLFNYLRSKASDMLNAKTMGNLLYDYFKENNQTLRYLILLNKLGVKNATIEDLEKKFSKLIKVRPQLDVNSPTLNAILLEDDVIQEYGYDVITSILKYNSGAHEVIIDAIINKDEILNKWISYLKKLPIYDEKILHFALINYNSLKDLINSLITDNVTLNQNQIINLKNILLSNNKYNVQNISDLNKYDEYSMRVLKDKINSSDINVLKDGILEHLFNTSLEETVSMFDSYGLFNEKFVNEYILKSDILSVMDEAIIEIVREICKSDDVDELKLKYEDIKDIGNVFTSLDSLDIKLKQYYSSCLNNSLFRYSSESDTVVCSKVSGINGVGFTDINGNYILPQSKIDVVSLEGEPFNLLVYSQPHQNNQFKNSSMEVIDNPCMWNELNNDVILTNLISDKHISCVDHGNKNAVYYGFNEISKDSLMFMSRRDVVIENLGKNLNSNIQSSEYMLPNVLNSVSSSFNTIGINAFSSMSSDYGHRVQPNFIVCFDGYINTESKKAAQYFNIPIYMINRDKYNTKNSKCMEKYIDEDISSLKEDDLVNIIYTRSLGLKERYDLFLKLYDNLNESESRLDDALRLINAYSIHNDISTIDLKEILDRQN